MGGEYAESAGEFNRGLAVGEIRAGKWADIEPALTDRLHRSNVYVDPPSP
jgi:hypothetical protein